MTVALAASALHSQPAAASDVQPFHDTIETKVMPALATLSDEISSQGRSLRIAGMLGFNPEDKFLPGKIAIGTLYPLLDVDRDDARFPARLAAYRRTADLTVNDVNTSWGIYYYLLALYKLKQAGLLDRAISPATLEILRAKLDWRTFVDDKTLELIDLPNNYYGVAFSVARLRYLLGWESEATSKALLARTLDHYRRYSGIYGFADETDGDGRFDRYSVLLIGEIAQRFLETGLEPPAEVRAWLRKSVDLLLPRMNLAGQGFEYGRSIGPYGDTAFLEVLSAAARLKLLTPTEERMAYDFSSRVAARYMTFWFDPTMKSVNMWRSGRATDAYRGEHRILGENLSLFRQLVYTDAIWDTLGYRDKPLSPDFVDWLRTLPRTTTTWFARGEYDRALVTIRDGSHVIGLPLVNGANGYHRRNAYFPAPFSVGMLASAPDQTWPQLTPRISLTDGPVLMPLAFFKDVRVRSAGKTTEVRVREDSLDDVSGVDGRRDDRASAETRFTFTPGRITRTDAITQDAPGSVSVEFGSFSTGAHVHGTRIVFDQGAVRSFSASGYDMCGVRDVSSDPAYHSVTGAMRTAIRCTRAKAAGKYVLGWQVRYR